MAKDRKLYLNERTTIRDVAQEAGVSLTTVSHALNGYKDVSEKTESHGGGKTTGLYAG